MRDRACRRGRGLSGAFLNPFTVGVGQGIAGVPLFSGMGYRLFVWTVITAIAMVYVLRHAKRVRREPGGEFVDDTSHVAVTSRHFAVLAVLLVALAAVVVGSMRLSWGLDQLAALFVAAAALCGLVGGLGASATAERFVEGTAGIAGGALVVGLARGVLVIFDGAGVTDTLLDAMAGAVAGLPAWASVLGIYGVQVALSYVVPSGSGQAALALPILVPLADMVGRDAPDLGSGVSVRRRLLEHSHADAGLLHGGLGASQDSVRDVGAVHRSAAIDLARRGSRASAHRSRHRLVVMKRGHSPFLVFEKRECLLFTSGACALRSTRRRRRTRAARRREARPLKSPARS